MRLAWPVLIGGFAAVIPAVQVGRIAADPGGAYISPDRPVRRAMDRAVPASRADLARNPGWTGRGVKVAVAEAPGLRIGRAS